MFVTESVADAGMDSIGFLMRKHVIVVTVKDKNELHVYGAMNGKFKKSIKRENAYPNGITTINDQFVLVTERDNKQVAVFNSSMDFLGTFGNDELRSPYGITFYKQGDNSYKVLVTDSYEYNNPREDRILSWDFIIENEEFSVGPATVLGNPTLYQVESIQADKQYDTLLVAEEMKEYHTRHQPKEIHYPTQITRSLVEEFSGKPFEYEEILPAYENYQPNIKPAAVEPSTRALADMCLVLLNANEFVYLY